MKKKLTTMLFILAPMIVSADTDDLSQEDLVAIQEWLENPQDVESSVTNEPVRYEYELPVSDGAVLMQEVPAAQSGYIVGTLWTLNQRWVTGYGTRYGPTYQK